jgi:hypothetical protein
MYSTPPLALCENNIFVSIWATITWMEKHNMTLDDILYDIYALEDEMRVFERKYGVLSETFYESYINGEEPPHEEWVRDWVAWSTAYKLWLQRRELYKQALIALRTKTQSLSDLIEQTSRHESISVAV